MITKPFEFIDSYKLSALNITLEEYRHRRTGARHFHLDANDSNNAFLVAFLTVPQDSTGIAHILEHTSLCGSRRFPVRDPFFMMIRRSLNTFMNAFTASDWTAYPFATQNRKDFDNLLQVYIDAVFFPRLDPLDFAQEGCRIEFEVPEDPTSALTYKGVVYNEMKGAMSPPIAQLAQALQNKLFPTITYHHNSGGDPLAIPNLTHADLIAFHARHYHPSNALFMTYGNFPCEDHQERIEALALHEFDVLAIDCHVPDERRYTQPITTNARYALDDEEPLTERTHVLLSWLLGRTTSALEVMQAKLLTGVLLEHSGSPLRQALETTDLGLSPSPLCGLDDSTREITFTCGLEGTEPERADEIERLILQVLSDIAAHGVDESAVNSVLHQVELSQREISGGGFPYGLQLMLRALTPVLHGGQARDALDLNPVIKELRRLSADPGFIPSLAQKLLHNPHRVRLVMTPDPELAKEHLHEETERLRVLRKRLNPRETAQIIELATELKQRQEASENNDLLPKVGLEDVPPDLRIPSATINDASHSLPITWFTPGTNGLFYHQLIIELPALTEHQLELLPLFCDLLTEVGCGKNTYLSTQAEQAAVTGGLGARTSYRANLNDVNTTQMFVVISSKSLVRNHREMIELLQRTLTDARFDEHQRIKELISQTRTHAEAQVTDSGHVLALAAACAGMGPCGYLDHHWGGLLGLQKLKGLDLRLKSAAAMADLEETLNSIRTALAGAPIQALAIAEPSFKQDITATLNTHWAAISRADSTFSSLILPPNPQQVMQAWAVNSQVNFCAKAYPCVPEGHEDAPTLRVLALFLRNGYLHRALREQGGAYGAGAHYSSDTASFRFFSYRDPRLAATLNDFDRSIDWLHNDSHSPAQLEEAVLGVIAGIDRPNSPAAEAMGSFFGTLHGRTPEHRRAFREQVLGVTLERLREVSTRYLHPQRASSAVVSGSAILDAQCPEDLIRHTL